MTTNDDFSAAFDKEAARVEDSDEVFALRESLREANSRLKRAKITSEAVADAAFRGAVSAVQAQKRPTVKPYKPIKAGNGDEEHALLMTSDWQGSKVTTTYNSDVTIERVHRFIDKSLSITEIQRHDHPVKDCTLMIGGDTIEGLFNFPTQPYEIDATLFDQFVNMATLLDSAVRKLAGEFRTVNVVAEWGNHGRLGSKRDAVPRSDNADRMTYRLAQEMTKDIPNVNWSIVADDVQRVEIGNYRALLLHGDEVGRNGYASPSTIVNHVTRWKSGSFRVEGQPWAFRDAYIGHYHTHQEYPLPDGEGAVYFTGSTESDNRYARDSMAASAVPTQRLHFVNPIKGLVTAQYKVWVD